VLVRKPVVVVFTGSVVFFGFGFLDLGFLGFGFLLVFVGLDLGWFS